MSHLFLLLPAHTSVSEIQNMFCATLVSGPVGMQTPSQCKHKFDVHKEIVKTFIGIKQFNPILWSVLWTDLIWCD